MRGHRRHGQRRVQAGEFPTQLNLLMPWPQAADHNIHRSHTSSSFRALVVSLKTSWRGCPKPVGGGFEPSDHGKRLWTAFFAPEPARNSFMAALDSRRSPTAISDISENTGTARLLQQQFQRTYQACQHCRQRKVKCVPEDDANGSMPTCIKCRRERRICVFNRERRIQRSSEVDDRDHEIGRTVRVIDGEFFSLPPSVSAESRVMNRKARASH